MSKRVPSCILAAIMSAAVMSTAAADEGFYIRLGAGLDMLKDSGIAGHKSDKFPTQLDATAAIDNGFTFQGAVGYGLDGGVRVEGEVGYGANDITSLKVREPGSLASIGVRKNDTLPLTGELQATTLMANLWYDIDIDSGLRPYVGGGGGVAFVTAEATHTTKAKRMIVMVDDRDTVFAWQVGAGLGYEFGDQGAVVSFDYRYHGTSKPTFTGAVTKTDFDAEYSGHYFGVGVRFGLDL